VTSLELLLVRLHVPLRGNEDGRLRSPEAFAEVENLLLQRFGGFSTGTEEGAWHDAATGETIREVLRTYEIATPQSRIQEVGECAREILRILNDREILLVIGDTSYVVTAEGRRPTEISPAHVSTEPAGWQKEFDVAIQAVISPELKALQNHFGVDPRKDLMGHNGDIYYRGSCPARSGNLSVVIHCQGHPGNDAAAVAAERLITLWRPKAIFLLGIAAGYRGKCKIGDVATPTVIVDDRLGVARLRRRLKRTQIYTPPHEMVQLLLTCPVDKEAWHRRLFAAMSPPRAPRGRTAEYKTDVARKPRHHDSAIYSSDLLLRDPNVLRSHQQLTHEQIRVGEMEAAGFSYACEKRAGRLPWFVVRGVADFGDEFKDDAFHEWASHSAASYLRCLLEDGFDLSLLRSLQEKSLTVQLKPGFGENSPTIR
jgi:nucleoside phosphorylase